MEYIALRGGNTDVPRSSNEPWHVFQFRGNLAQDAKRFTMRDDCRGIRCTSSHAPTMTMLDLEAICLQLNTERQELLQRAQIPLPYAKGDEVDLANIALDKERVLWLKSDARARVIAIEQALARIERGIYGKCINCAGSIPEERLSTIPLTQYCVECRTKLERPRKRTSNRDE